MAKIKAPPIQYEAFAPPPPKVRVGPLGAQPGPSYKLPARAPGDPTQQDRDDAAWYAHVKFLRNSTGS